MKFGRRLPFMKLLAWQAHYADYRHLKQIIKRVVSGKDTSGTLVHAFHAEVTRVAAFLSAKIEEASARTRHLVSRADDYILSSVANSHGASSLEAFLLTTATTLEHLTDFGHVNSEAFRKIAKKFAKKVPFASMSTLWPTERYPDCVGTLKSMADRIDRALASLKSFQRSLENLNAISGMATSATGVERLKAAIRMSDVDRIGFLLRSGDVPAAEVLRLGGPLMHECARYGDVQSVQYLLALSVNVDVPDVVNRTPLQNAARYNQAEVLNVLVANGASVLCTSLARRNVLHSAVQRGKKVIVSALLVHLRGLGTAGSGMGPTSGFGMGVGFGGAGAGAGAGRGLVVPVAVSSPRRGPSTVLAGPTPPSFVALRDVLKRLDGSGHNVFYIAAFNSHPKCLALLLEAAHDVIAAQAHDDDDAAATAGATAGAGTGTGLKSGGNPLCDLLRAPRLSESTPYEWTALAAAARVGSVECLTELTEAGACVNDAVGVEANTALHVAVTHGHLGCVAGLLDAGAVPTALNHRSETPLHLASRLARVDCLTLLVSHCPDWLLFARPSPEQMAAAQAPPAFKSQRWIPVLQEAVIARNSKCIEVLVHAGADPCASDHDGWSAYAVALYTGQLQLAEDMLKLGRASSAPAASAKTPPPVDGGDGDGDGDGAGDEDAASDSGSVRSDQTIEEKNSREAGNHVLPPDQWELRVYLGGLPYGTSKSLVPCVRLETGSAKLVGSRSRLTMARLDVESPDPPTPVVAPGPPTLQPAPSAMSSAAVPTPSQPPRPPITAASISSVPSNPTAAVATSRTVGGATPAKAPGPVFAFHREASTPPERRSTDQPDVLSAKSFLFQLEARKPPASLTSPHIGPTASPMPPDIDPEDGDEDHEERYDLPAGHHRLPVVPPGHRDLRPTLSLDSPVPGSDALMDECTTYRGTGPHDFLLSFTVISSVGALVGRAVVPPDLLVGPKNNLRLDGQVSVSLLSPFLTHVGVLTFRYVMVRPFVPAVPRALSRAIRPFWKQTKVVGHRGMGADNAALVSDPAGMRRRRTHVKENTLLSFVTAASLGAEYVEFDVQLTKDKVPVVHHNFIVDLPGGLGIPVTHLTVDQFTSLTPRAHGEPAHADGDGGDGGDGDGNPSRGLRRQASERVMQTLGLDVERHARLADRFYTGIRDSFATLENALTKLPARVGFNVEVKYPDPEEVVDLGLAPVGLNEYVERILECIFRYAGGRSIMFSSFHPDLCVLLAKKQAAYPVFLLTESGTCSHPDPRRISIREAVRFAAAENLLGIVAQADPMVKAPRLITAAREAGLVLCTWGRINNDVAAVQLQRRYGVAAVIVDHVAHITKGIRPSSSRPSSPGPTRGDVIHEEEETKEETA